MNTLRLLPLLAVITLLLGITSCRDDDPVSPVSSGLAADHPADVPLAWYQLFEEIDRYAEGYRPPAAARALAYIGLAAYEAAVPGMPDHNSIYRHLAGLNLPTVTPGAEYHWPTCVNAAYATTIRKFYPHIPVHLLARVDHLDQSFHYAFETAVHPEVFERSRTFGTDIGDAVYAWSTTDAAGHNAYLNPRPASYIPPSGPGLWQPTRPDYTPALFPYWGQVRTFAMKGQDLVAKPPLAWSEDPDSPLYTQARETMIWVNEINAGRDDEGHWIAEFWSDDFGGVTFTPAGRWIAIASQVVGREQPTLADAVKLYAQMGMALCDAGIAVWHSKYLYNYERPIHYINRNFDPTWQTIMDNPATGVTGITPEFPSYPSGHSGFGGAAATVLTDVFGYSYTFTDNCHKDRTEFRGTPRTFGTFIDMAVENAFSRIPLGVHFRMDCDEGLKQGYLAGHRVLALPWRK